MTAPDVVVLERVTKRYSSLTAVGDLSLRIPQGALFGLLGPNGAGKTTTLRMLMGILIPDEGSIHVFGEPLSERIQDPLLYWVVPILRVADRPDEVPEVGPNRHEGEPGVWGSQGRVMNYVRIHAGDKNEESVP